MKVIMTKKEFLQLREIIINIDNPTVTEEFNKICTNKNSRIDVATTQESFTMTVSEDLSTEIGKVLKAYSKNLGKSLSLSLSNLPKIVKQIKNLVTDLGNAIKNVK